MQVISVERWTFRSAVAVFGPVPATGFGNFTRGSNGTATTVAFASVVALVVFVWLLASVAMGGSREPSVRSLPATGR